MRLGMKVGLGPGHTALHGDPAPPRRYQLTSVFFSLNGLKAVYTSLVFADQYAFLPMGSTTAALVAMLHSITDLLSTNSYVIVLVLDFSKAFDTGRHNTLLQKIGLLDIPDSVYKWFVNFFSERRHSTR